MEEYNGSVVDGLTLMQNMDMDSISYIKMIIMLETEYDIAFEPEELILDSFSSVGDIAKYIQKNRK